MLWEALSWLKSNYRSKHGIPAFFVEGQYSYNSKDVAISDYKITVAEAAHSDDESFASWAKEVQEKEFYILENDSCTNFWHSKLLAENRRVDEAVYEETVHRTKKRKTTLTVFPPNDTQLKADTKKIAVDDMKSFYLKTIGMNSIREVSDKPAGSDVSFGKLSNIANECKGIVKAKKGNAKKSLKLIQKVHDKADKYDMVKNVYEIILELHVYDAYLFEKSYETLLSEANLVVKLWGPLYEKLFRGSNVMLQWGDATPDAIKECGLKSRLDLRLFSWDGSKDTIVELGVNEFSREAKTAKYYYDLQKMCLCSKAYINQIIKNFPGLTAEMIKAIQVPFVITMKFQAQVYIIKMESPKVYSIEKLFDLNIPADRDDMKKDGIHNLLAGLARLKEISLRLDRILRTKEKLIEERKNNIDRLRDNNPESKESIYAKWVDSKVWSTKPPVSSYINSAGCNQI
ncbi:uncharacterized protein ATC70_008115 [Mucor velutinosus]|uniref:Uncharacterized protein n=1 Tax=Mucor velutinosus TaxID=708070 RepID=A0AAN7D6X8_9FUNG|nr:hypothetical protein ATC70_008115 [Mucor velutinosus]